jgi:hypothetical protein
MSHSATDRPMKRGLLYFGFLGGAVAWTLHLLLAYIVAEFGCETDADRHIWLGITLPAWLILGQSAIMFIAAAAATWIAWRIRARLSAVEPTHDRWMTADIYLARAGFMASGLFAFIIAVQTIPIFYYLRSC